MESSKFSFDHLTFNISHFTLLALFITLIYSLPVSAQTFVLKTNALHDLTGTFSIGTEYAINDHTTLETTIHYNPWTYEDNHKNRFLSLQPAWKQWITLAFNGFFYGVEAHVGIANRCGTPNRALLPEPMFGISAADYASYRYQGWQVGGGLLSGYAWILSKRLSLEASLGVGYTAFLAKKYNPEVGGSFLEKRTKNLFGVTQLGLSFVYVIF